MPSPPGAAQAFLDWSSVFRPSDKSVMHARHVHEEGRQTQAQRCQKSWSSRQTSNARRRQHVSAAGLLTNMIQVEERENLLF
jgi:hypothetical protein